jgi:Asp-tRNA(Asn)/Glu-tRNA(Gln) amidotransferase A subunit family amidase
MAIHQTICTITLIAVVLAMLTTNLNQAVASSFLWVSGLWRSSSATMAIKLEETSIAQILVGLDEGHFTVAELVEVSQNQSISAIELLSLMAALIQCYIARIEHLNPQLRAISQLNPDARSIAHNKDTERSTGASRGILHGVPILVKDVFLTKDRLMSTSKTTFIHHHR